MTTLIPAQFDALPDREVDALVAEKVMGQEVKWARRIPCGPHDMLCDPMTGDIPLPYYSTDLNACRDMMHALPIEDYDDNGEDCRERFSRALIQITDARKHDMLNAVIWDGAFATARQKCKAALMALGVITEAAQEGGRE